MARQLVDYAQSRTSRYCGEEMASCSWVGAGERKEKTVELWRCQKRPRARRDVHFGTEQRCHSQDKHAEGDKTRCNVVAVDGEQLETKRVNSLQIMATQPTYVGRPTGAKLGRGVRGSGRRAPTHR